MSISRKLMRLDIHGLHALFSDSRNDVVVLNEIKAELDSRWTCKNQKIRQILELLI